MFCGTIRRMKTDECASKWSKSWSSMVQVHSTSIFRWHTSYQRCCFLMDEVSSSRSTTTSSKQFVWNNVCRMSLFLDFQMYSVVCSAFSHRHNWLTHDILLVSLLKSTSSFELLFLFIYFVDDGYVLPSHRSLMETLHSTINLICVCVWLGWWWCVGDYLN